MACPKCHSERMPDGDNARCPDCNYVAPFPSLDETIVTEKRAPFAHAAVDRTRAMDESSVGGVDWVSTADMEPPSRQIGNYRILGHLGAGGMGMVFRAEQQSPKREVALKVLVENQGAKERDRLRFRREAAVIALLNHPYIVPIIEFGETDSGDAFYTMPLVDGEPLERYVKKRKLRQRQVIQLFIQICEGVEAAHRSGAIHRDLKPSNIMVTEDGRPQVLDFGLAKIIAEDDLPGDEDTPRRTTTSIPDEASVDVSRDGECIGTPAFMSPEQTVPNETIDTRSDTYSLGVVLFRVLLDEYPYTVGGSPRALLHAIRTRAPIRPRALQPGFSSDLEAIILKALSKDRDERYQSAAALASDLEAFLDRRPVSARDDTPWYRLARFVGRNQAGTTLVVLAAIALIAVVLFSFARVRSERDRATAEKDRAVSAEVDAQLARRDMERMLAESLVSQGDAQALLRNWETAKARYEHALELTEPKHTTSLSAQIGLWQAERAAPPPYLTITGGHDGNILTVAVGGRERVLVTGGADHAVRVWELHTGREMHSLSGHNAPVFCAALAPDGQALITGDWDGYVIHWELHTGKKRWHVRPSSAPISAVAFAADGRHSAAVSDTGDLVLWDQEGQIVCEQKKGQAATALAVGKENVFIGLADGSIGAQTIAGKALWKVRAHSDSILGIAGAGGKQIWTAGYGELFAWDVASGEKLHAKRTTDKQLLSLVARGDRVYAIGGSGTLDEFILSTGEHLKRNVMLAPLNAAIARDGSSVAICSTHGTVSIYGLADTSPLARRLTGHDGVVEAVALSGEQPFCVTGGWDKQVIVWDVATGKTLRRLQGHERGVVCLAISPDGRYVASGSVDKTVRLWSLVDDQVLRIDGQDSPVQNVSFSADSAYVAVGWRNGVVELRAVPDGALVRRMERHETRVTSVRFHPRMSLLASSDNSGKLVLWDIKNDKYQDVILSAGIHDLAWSADGGALAVAEHGGEINVLTRSLQSLNVFVHGDSSAGVVTFLRDDTLVTGGRDGTVTFWNWRTGEQTRAVAMHAGSITDLAVGGGFILSCSRDRTAVLGDMQTPMRYRAMQPRVNKALRTLQAGKESAVALRVLGTWYAEHGAWLWSRELLRHAGDLGAVVDPLLGARIAWQLDRTDECRRALNGVKGRTGISDWYLRYWQGSLPANGHE